MHANDDLMALRRPCKMTRSLQRIVESMEPWLRRNYALKCDRFKSLVQACSEQFKNRLYGLELRRQTNIEVIATYVHNLV